MIVRKVWTNGQTIVNKRTNKERTDKQKCYFQNLLRTNGQTKMSIYRNFTICNPYYPKVEQNAGEAGQFASLTKTKFIIISSAHLGLVLP